MLTRYLVTDRRRSRCRRHNSTSKDGNGSGSGRISGNNTAAAAAAADEDNNSRFSRRATVQFRCGITVSEIGTSQSVSIYARMLKTASNPTTRRQRPTQLWRAKCCGASFGKIRFSDEGNPMSISRSSPPIRRQRWPQVRVQVL